MHISPARRIVYEIVPATFFPYGKTRSRNILKDYESRPAATNIKVFLWSLWCNLAILMFHDFKTGVVLEL